MYLHKFPYIISFIFKSFDCYILFQTHHWFSLTSVKDYCKCRGTESWKGMSKHKKLQEGEEGNCITQGCSDYNHSTEFIGGSGEKLDWKVKTGPRSWRLLRQKTSWIIVLRTTDLLVSLSCHSKITTTTRCLTRRMICPLEILETRNLTLKCHLSCTSPEGIQGNPLLVPSSFCWTLWVLAMITLLPADFS